LQKPNYKKMPTLLQDKMAQQGKQMTVRARESFPYHYVELVYWLTVTGMVVDSVNAFIFSSGKALYPSRIIPCPQL
jgi:hypothetical protein